MLRWRELPEYPVKNLNQIGNRIAKYIYLLFFIGLASRILAIKPSKISAIGLEFTVNNSDVVPGLFFVCVLFLSLYMIFLTFFYAFHAESSNKAFLRHLIYRVASKRVTVRKKSVVVRTLRDKDIRALKTVVAFLFYAYGLMQTVFVFFPAVYTLLFERSAVAAALSKLLH